MPSEPPTPSAEQLAQWQALVELVRQGDRSQVVAWDEGAAAGRGAAYQVLVTQRINQRLRDARPCWSVRSLASSPSCGWIPSRPA
jgi:hypothetical protein